MPTLRAAVVQAAPVPFDLDRSLAKAQQYIDAAASQGANLIVMGSRGLSDVAGLFLGSVTHKVIRLAKAAVLIDRTAPVVETVPAEAAPAVASDYAFA